MDRDVTKPLFGNYRAKVVDNVDTEQFGRVVVWIPDLMQKISDKEGIWARPANNPMGGRNTQYESDNHYAGSCYIPKIGSWTWVFFESGNINRPYYFGALEIEHAKVLPENQLGSSPSDKWTIFKSHEGRAVVISDDSSDARTEITGKKRSLSSPPSGDTGSVYTIDGNQTTILLDERSGKEKVLIRTHKGEFLHIDIDEQQLQIFFKSDVLIKTDGNFNVTAAGDINLKSLGGDVNIQSNSGDMNLKSGGDMNKQAGGSMNNTAQINFDYSAGAEINGLAGGNMNHDACMLNEMTGQASPAGEAEDAEEAAPEGERDT